MPGSMRNRLARRVGKRIRSIQTATLSEHVGSAKENFVLESLI